MIVQSGSAGKAGRRVTGRPARVWIAGGSIWRSPLAHPAGDPGGDRHEHDRGDPAAVRRGSGGA
jgi:hypothetical protein